jgi:hypothetical protein
MVRFVCAFTRSDNRSIFAVHGHSGETYLRTLRSRPEARAIQNIQMNSTFSITEGLTPLVLSVRFCNADKAKLEALLESSVFFVPTGSGIRRTIVQNMITICFNHNMRVLVNHLRVRFIVSILKSYYRFKLTGNKRKYRKKIYHLGSYGPNIWRHISTAGQVCYDSFP